MANASIQLADGTQVTVEGTPDEVARVLAALQKPRATAVHAEAKKDPSTSTKKTSSGPGGRIRELKTGGFFETPRELQAVKEELAVKGHHYVVENLSTPILRLVRQGELRRFKGQNGQWNYTNP